MKYLFWKLSKGKKALMMLCCLGIIFSMSGLVWAFYQENTVGSAAEGGRFTVGAVASIDQNFLLNPVFVVGNAKATSVEADVSRLLFAGLMRFDTETGDIQDHLADHTLSEDKKTYTFTLKQGVTWHDGTSVTADDIIFTYQTVIQNETFGNAFLRNAFSGVGIEKIDDKSVAFTLPKPYKFFLTNFTVGLLPHHLLSATPVENLQFDEFNQNPIGTGPYRFSGVSSADQSPIATLSLEAFSEYISGKPKIAFIDFNLFPNNDLLVQNLNKLDALRPQRKSEYNFLKNNGNFRLLDFTIPQYAAVFINMDAPGLSGDVHQKIRLALQLATDKDVISKVVDGKRIDTPLLETDTSEWLFEYDPEKAAGALKDSGYYLGDKMPDESLPDEEEAEEAESSVKSLQYITEPSAESPSQINSSSSFLVGNVPEGTRAVEVNGYRLRLFNAEKGTFSYKIDSNIGTLKKGENSYVVKFLNASNQEILSETAVLYFESEIPEGSSTEAEDAPVENQIVERRDIPDNIRRTQDGQVLEFRLVTIDQPAFYPQVAEILKSQWEAVGIRTTIEVLDQETFIEKALRQKDYDLLLYGQNLGYNPDAYPFWHFSQAEDGSNLSKYKRFEAGVLLEEIRQTHDENVRQEKLTELRNIIRDDVPAVFLFSPLYTVPMNAKVKNVSIEHVAILADLFSNVEWWYIRESRTFESEKSWFGFFPWFFTSIADTIS